MKIIGISGRKQSGKNTAANFINGQILKSLNMIEDFFINDDGQLIVNTSDSNGNEGYGIFDIIRKDPEFISYAEKELWPYVKIYHFADMLKELCINLFGLSVSQVYGSDIDKNTLTKIRWENIPGVSNQSFGPMTAREFLQYFGTTIVRQIYDNAWVDSTIKRILSEDSKIAIVPDIRFPNEVEAIKKNNGIVIRLTRSIDQTNHPSESSLDRDKYDWSNFDFVIDNNNISIENFCVELNKINFLWK